MVDNLRSIDDFVASLDPADIVMRFDVHFDRPFEHGRAIGALEMVGAFDTAIERRPAIRIGAYWCAIVRADVGYSLARGLHLVEESREAAESLAVDLLARGDRQAAAQITALSPEEIFDAYATARWFDGAGKINYRVGNFARARMYFAKSLKIAQAWGIWWCVPDILSNLLRGEYEEQRQSDQDGEEKDAKQLAFLVDHIGALRRARSEHHQDAEQFSQNLREESPATDRQPTYRQLEFLRGYASLTHNLSVALMGIKPGLWKTMPRSVLPVAPSASERDAESLTLSEEAGTISEAMDDDYRQSQALLHQAQILTRTDEGRKQAYLIYERLTNSKWVRGKRLALQNRARARGDEEALADLKGLIDDYWQDSETAGHSAGMDIDFIAWTVNFYAEVAAGLRDRHSPERQRELQDEIRTARQRAARTVRKVIALPSYKQAYAKAIYPVFQEMIGRLVDEKDDAQGRSIDPQAPTFGKTTHEDRHERILALSEECSARNLLDLMAAANLPQLRSDPSTGSTGRPPGSGESPAFAPSRPPAASTGLTRGAVSRPIDGGGRRSAPQRSLKVYGSKLYDVLLARQQEFERAFLDTPLEAAPDDKDVANKLNMLTANDPGCCVLRFISYRSADPEQTETLWGAVVAQHGRQEFVTNFDSTAVNTLVRSINGTDDEGAPRDATANSIWELLIEPVWDRINRGWAGSAPSESVAHQDRHLIIVPSDELFEIPFHIATERAWHEPPLGAMVPMSYSVSVTALVSRGRHLLKVQPVDRRDDLGAVICLDTQNQDSGIRVSGEEILDLGWPVDQVHIVGDLPPGVDAGVHQLGYGWQGLQELAARRPEFFVYAAHGERNENFPDFGPALQLPTGDPAQPDYLTSFDAALRLQLPRNRLSLIGACLAGRGAMLGGGEVGGFLRALMAAGAGAIGLPLWSVEDDEIVAASHHLLRRSRQNADTTGKFDVVYALWEYYHDRFEALGDEPDASDTSGPTFADHFPLALYL
ncbi:MAG TPA: CHAT domain-containing protein [Kineosporiaceae bacterium]|nr:CHAT domain-containing protein [Kineosporiaceae bacterium]